MDEDDNNESNNTESGKELTRRYEPLMYGKVIKWFILQMTYTFLGALLFLFLEECHGKDKIPDKNYEELISYIEKRKDLVEDEKITFKNVSKEFYQSLLETTECEMSHDVIAKWWSFTIVTCYTIGYGRVTPRTIHGKLVTMIYAIIGIPLSISMYSYASYLVTSAIRNTIIFLEMKLFNTTRVKHLHAKTLFFSFTIFLLFFFSLVYFNTLENHGDLSVIDSMYYWFQTLTTIGYGDVHPGTEHNDLTETLLRISYMFGLGMTASLISSISIFLHVINKKKMNKLLHLTRKRRKSWTLDNSLQLHTFQNTAFDRGIDTCS